MCTLFVCLFVYLSGTSCNGRYISDDGPSARDRIIDLMCPVGLQNDPFDR